MPCMELGAFPHPPTTHSLTESSAPPGRSSGTERTQVRKARIREVNPLPQTAWTLKSRSRPSATLAPPHGSRRQTCDIYPTGWGPETGTPEKTRCTRVKPAGPWDSGWLLRWHFCCCCQSSKARGMGLEVLRWSLFSVTFPNCLRHI